MLVYNTPIEKYEGIWVKREDLCATPPDPAFSKFRGVVAHLQKRPESVIGVLDTFHSQAGWAVSSACKLLGKRCINFWPRYKSESPDLIRKPQLQSQSLGAELRELKAGKSIILHHRSKKLLLAEFPKAYLMPNALKLEESVEETAVELLRKRNDFPRYIVSVSSGTIAAGVLRGLSRVEGGMLFKTPPQVYLHMGYSRSQDSLRNYLKKLAPQFPQSHIHLIDEGYEYSQMATGKAPFPCNSFYDLKAWLWLSKQSWKKESMFWNIGS